MYVFNIIGYTVLCHYNGKYIFSISTAKLAVQHTKHEKCEVTHYTQLWDS